MHLTIFMGIFYVYILNTLLEDFRGSYASGVMAWPSYCPHTCTCSVRMSSMSQKYHNTIDCSGEVLTQPPVNISSDVETLLFPANRIHPESLDQLVDFINLTELNLAQNHIYGLGDIPEALPSLLYLTIDGNEIDYFANKSFWWAPHLHILSARKNKLELMHAKAFAGLNNLKSLDLSGNRLFSVIPEWFKDLRTLETLNMGENNIHVIRDDAFRRLDTLRVLDISYNQLQHIYDFAFRDLVSLKRFTLQGNSLKSIPLLALKQLRSLKELNLDANQFSRFDKNAISDLNITTLTLNHLDKLEFIDRYSFVNLTFLERLELMNNKVLNFIDPETFFNIPKLEILDLQHNNLSVIEESMLSSLPSLQTLTINDNSLFCDCNLWWLIDEYTDHTRNLSLPPPESLTCDAPSALKGISIVDKQVTSMSRECAPRILPLFSQKYTIDLGDPLRLDCRTVGKPNPQTDWLLPIHKELADEVMVLKTGEHDGSGDRRIAEHISISRAGTLLVDYAHGTDTGEYTCLASNPQGRDERTAHVHVQTNLANVIILSVSPHSVTLTWRSTSYEHHYQIAYRQSRSNDTYHVISIEPYMRSFTANGLLPKSRYEFCIALRQGANLVRINCTIVHTKRKEEPKTGLFEAKNYIISGAAVGLILLILLGCTVTYHVKKYNKRKRQEEELYSDNLSQLFLASMDSMSDTTPITYENPGAEMFDDDDIEEIRSTASMPCTSSNCSTTVIK